MKNVFGYSDVPVICISISGLNKNDQTEHKPASHEHDYLLSQDWNEKGTKMCFDKEYM